MKPSPEEFPAAHSMDTTWFAAHANGHIAAFQTGEAGSVPERALNDEDLFYRIDDIIEIAEASGNQFRIDEMLVEPNGKFYWYRFDEEMPKKFKELSKNEMPLDLWCVLLWLKDETLFDADDPSENQQLWKSLLEHTDPQYVPKRIPYSTAVLAYVKKMPKDILLAIKSENLIRKAWVNFEFRPVHLGWYSYKHEDEFENWISGPYGCTAAPANPMHLDQLPQELRQKLSAARLEYLKFNEAKRIQPAEHEPCNSWQNEFVDLEGNRHEF